MPNPGVRRARTPSWRPLTVLTGVVVVIGLFPVATEVWRAWAYSHPILIPWNDSLGPIDDRGDAWLPALSFVSLLILMGSPGLVLSTLLLGIASVPRPSRAIKAWLCAFGLLLVAWMVVPYLAVGLWAGDDQNPPGPAYFAAFAGLQLVIVAGIVAVVAMVIRPCAYRPGVTDAIAPPGWYTDPEGASDWRWWDGAEWTATSA